MIPKPIEKLVREISRDVVRRRQRREIPDPEEWLIVLLSNIQQQMGDNDRVSAMLEPVVDRTLSEERLAEAGKLLKRSKQRKPNGAGKNKRQLSVA